MPAEIHISSIYACNPSSRGMAVCGTSVGIVENQLFMGRMEEECPTKPHPQKLESILALHMYAITLSGPESSRGGT